MISIFPKKKEIKLREVILKGVYEDNLRILGRIKRPIPNKTVFPLKKISLYLVVIVLALLINVNFHDLSIFSKKEMAIGSYREASLLSQESFLSTDNRIKTIDYDAFLSILERQLYSSHKKPEGLNDYKAFLSAPKISFRKLFGLKVKTIMIDPGHGGFYNGAIGKLGTREKDITLDIARRLRDRLIKYGKFNVLMTRDRDITVSLDKRVELAKLNKADLFISIHVNYLVKNPENIIETYFFGPPSDTNTLRLAERENSDAQYGLSDFKEIIEKIGDTLKYQESKRLATSIQKNLFLNIKKQNKKVLNHGVKRAPFIVLLGVDVPAVLAEVSCLSNLDEEIKLNSPQYREDIAYYLESGILDYLNKGEIKYEAKRR